MSNEITKDPAVTPTTEATPRWSRPPVDVFEAADRFVFVLDVPGANPGNVELHAEGRQLTLEAPLGDGRGWRRSFELGDTVDVDAAEAKVERGVLTLTLPKREAPSARRIEVRG